MSTANNPAQPRPGVDSPRPADSEAASILARFMAEIDPEHYQTPLWEMFRGWLLSDALPEQSDWKDRDRVSWLYYHISNLLADCAALKAPQNVEPSTV